MRRWTEKSKVPKDHLVCPVCDEPYLFVRCRVTVQEKTGPRNLCLICFRREKEELSTGVENIKKPPVV